MFYGVGAEFNLQFVDMLKIVCYLILEWIDFLLMSIGGDSAIFWGVTIMASIVSSYLYKWMRKHMSTVREQYWRTQVLMYFSATSWVYARYLCDHDQILFGSIMIFLCFISLFLVVMYLSEWVNELMIANRGQVVRDLSRYGFHKYSVCKMIYDVCYQMSMYPMIKFVLSLCVKRVIKGRA